MKCSMNNWKDNIEKLKHIIMVFENSDGVKVGVRLILLYDHGISKCL